MTYLPSTRRAGRKSNSEAKRKDRTTRWEREQEDAGPTKETLAQRLMAMGFCITDRSLHKDRLRAMVVEVGGTSAGIDFPLDLLLRRQYIDGDEHEAGWVFARARWSLFGVPTLSVSALYERMISRGSDEFTPKRETAETPVGDEQQKHRDRRVNEYNAGLSILSEHGALARDAVMNICVFLRMPRVIAATHILERDWNELAALRGGLRALGGVYFRQQRRAV